MQHDCDHYRFTPRKINSTSVDGKHDTWYIRTSKQLYKRPAARKSSHSLRSRSIASLIRRARSGSVGASACISDAVSLPITSSPTWEGTRSSPSAPEDPVRVGTRNTPRRSKSDCLLVSSSTACCDVLELEEEIIPRSQRLTRQNPKALVRRRNQRPAGRHEEKGKPFIGCCICEKPAVSFYSFSGIGPGRHAVGRSKWPGIP